MTKSKIKARPHEKEAIWLECRLHLNPQNPEYKDFFERNFDSSISAYETHSNRPHVHILGKIRKMRAKQLHESLIKMFKVDGNADFSITNLKPTEEDHKRMFQYVCKGENSYTMPVIMFNTPDWTEEIIKQHHDNYYAIQNIDTDFSPNSESVKVDLNKLVPEQELPKKRVARKTFTQKLVDELEVEYPKKKFLWTEPEHRSIIINYVLKKLGDTRKIFNEFKIREYVYACFNTADELDFRHYMSCKVYSIL